MLGVLGIDGVLGMEGIDGGFIPPPPPMPDMPDIGLIGGIIPAPDWACCAAGALGASGRLSQFGRQTVISGRQRLGPVRRLHPHGSRSADWIRRSRLSSAPLDRAVLLCMWRFRRRPGCLGIPVALAEPFQCPP